MTGLGIPLRACGWHLAASEAARKRQEAKPGGTWSASVYLGARIEDLIVSVCEIENCNAREGLRLLRAGYLFRALELARDEN